jgi:hypothetical protein
MPEVSRRTLLVSLLAVPLVAAGCAPTEQPVSSEEPPPPPADDVNVDTASITIPAPFGPTGQHWPSRTPKPRDRFDFTVDVDPTWTAIADGIARANAAGASKNAVVRVRPGVLPGNGAGSTSKPVLRNVGKLGRKSRVLVVPRDGAGTVTLAASIRLELVRGVAFVGFWNFPYSAVFSAPQDFAWAWSKGQAFNITANSSEPTADVELVECVTPDARLNDQDVWGFRTDGQTMTGVSVIGCYVAPSYKAAGSSAHCDTLQLSGTHPAAGVVIKDSVIFASTNAAVIPFDRAVDITFDHSLVVGGDRMLQRFPLPDGANAFTSGFPSSVNGSGTVDILSARDSTFLGPVRGTWKSAERSTVSTASVPKSTTGAFVSDLALATVDAVWMDQVAPARTDDQLRAMWKA